MLACVGRRTYIHDGYNMFRTPTQYKTTVVGNEDNNDNNSNNKADNSKGEKKNRAS